MRGQRDFSIKSVNGVRNDLSPERLSEHDLVSGVNINIDDTGKTSRRKGQRRIITGTDIHSLGEAAKRAFFVDGTTLYEINVDESVTVRKTGMATGRRTSYLNVNGAVYFMNGVNTGVISGEHVRSLGIVPPQPLNAVATAGNLPAGTYGVTMTYVMLNGMESGAPICTFVTGTGIDFQSLPVSANPDVVTKRIYVTEQNGEAPYLAMTLPNSATTAVHGDVGPRAILCVTQFKTAMPAGDVLGIYNGRLYVAVGNVLFYSEPYNFELCDMRQNYLQFSSRITIIAPVKDGIFLGTENETSFLAGPDPAGFDFTVLSPFGSVFGTLSYADPRFVTRDGLKGLVPMWNTVHGPCAGANGGAFIELTSDRYVLPDVKSGASLYRYESGTSHFLSVLYQ